MRLLSIQTGQVKTHGTAGAAEPMEREWVTGFYKTPAAGRVYATSTHLEGDGQADLKVHGGPDKAINVYPADHFAYWREDLGLEMTAGAFGENFTTSGALEDEVCIGDVYRIGEVVVEVTQPREPCWKLARRWRTKDLAARVEKTGKTGWYFRVLKEGWVEASVDLILVERPYPQWTIAKANEVMHQRKQDWAAALALSECPAISAIWREALSRRHLTRTVEGNQARLGGNDS